MGNLEQNCQPGAGQGQVDLNGSIMTIGKDRYLINSLDGENEKGGKIIFAAF
jgi:hypothetical protein